MATETSIPLHIAERRKQSKERTRSQRRKAGAIVATFALAATAAVAPEVKNSLSKNLQKEAITYSGDYAIPDSSMPYRALTIGDKKIISFRSSDQGFINTAEVRLANTGSVADYIHQQNPSISREEALDLISAEVAQDQKDEGIPESDVDHTLVQNGQEIRLPIEWNVGDLVMPDDNQ